MLILCGIKICLPPKVRIVKFIKAAFLFINSTGPKWKELRPLLSPAFTSSKMKLMYTLMDESALRFVQHFKNQDKNVLEVELKDTLSRFTNDIIATTAFGIECDSLKYKTNQFYLMGKIIASALFGWRGLLLRLFGFNLFPNITKVPRT